MVQMPVVFYRFFHCFYFYFIKPLGRVTSCFRIHLKLGDVATIMTKAGVVVSGNSICHTFIYIILFGK